MKWISYMYTYIPSLLDLPPTPHPTHLGQHRAQSWAPCALQQVPTSYLFYTGQCTYVNPSVPIHLPPPAPRCVHTSVLYVCASIPALQTGSSVPFLNGWKKSNEAWYVVTHENYRVHISVSRSKVLLAQIHMHPFTCCSWQLSHHTRDAKAHKAENIDSLAPSRKSLATPLVQLVWFTDGETEAQRFHRFMTVLGLELGVS